MQGVFVLFAILLTIVRRKGAKRPYIWHTDMNRMYAIWRGGSWAIGISENWSQDDGRGDPSVLGYFQM